jgi:hypothetical protein
MKHDASPAKSRRWAASYQLNQWICFYSVSYWRAED